MKTLYKGIILSLFFVNAVFAQQFLLNSPENGRQMIYRWGGEFDWQDYSGTMRYIFQISRTEGFNSIMWKTPFIFSECYGSALPWSNLSIGSRYFWRVVAISNQYDESSVIGVSDVRNFDVVGTTPPIDPKLETFVTDDQIGENNYGTFSVKNSGGGTLDFKFTKPEWIGITPAPKTLSAGQSQIFNIEALASGYKTGNIMVSSFYGTNNLQVFYIDKEAGKISVSKYEVNLSNNLTEGKIEISNTYDISKGIEFQNSNSWFSVTAPSNVAAKSFSDIKISITQQITDNRENDFSLKCDGKNFIIKIKYSYMKPDDKEKRINKFIFYLDKTPLLQVESKDGYFDTPSAFLGYTNPNILHFSGQVIINNLLNVKGEFQIDSTNGQMFVNGNLYFANIPILGKISDEYIIASGEFNTDPITGPGSISIKLLNPVINNVTGVFGIKFNLTNFEFVTSDGNPSILNPEGVRISFNAKIPYITGACDSKATEVKVKDLYFTRKGIYAEKVEIRGLGLPFGFCVENFNLSYFPDEDRLSVKAKVNGGELFDYAYGWFEIAKGKIINVEAKLDLNKWFPIGNSSFGLGSFGFGLLNIGTASQTVYLEGSGGILTAPALYELHGKLTWYYPDRFKIKGSIDLVKVYENNWVVRDATATIDLNMNTGMIISAYVNMFEVNNDHILKGNLTASANWTSAPEIRGSVSASMKLPELTGFPFDLIKSVNPDLFVIRLQGVNINYEQTSYAANLDGMVDLGSWLGKWGFGFDMKKKIGENGFFRFVGINEEKTSSFNKSVDLPQGNEQTTKFVLNTKVDRIIISSEGSTLKITSPDKNELIYPNSTKNILFSKDNASGKLFAIIPSPSLDEYRITSDGAVKVYTKELEPVKIGVMLDHYTGDEIKIKWNGNDNDGGCSTEISFYLDQTKDSTPEAILGTVMASSGFGEFNTMNLDLDCGNYNILVYQKDLNTGLTIKYYVDGEKINIVSKVDYPGVAYSENKNDTLNIYFAESAQHAINILWSDNASSFFVDESNMFQLPLQPGLQVKSIEIARLVNKKKSCWSSVIKK